MLTYCTICTSLLSLLSARRGPRSAPTPCRHTPPARVCRRSAARTDSSRCPECGPPPVERQLRPCKRSRRRKPGTLPHHRPGFERCGGPHRPLPPEIGCPLVAEHCQNVRGARSVRRRSGPTIAAGRGAGTRVADALLPLCVLQALRDGPVPGLQEVSARPCRQRGLGQWRWEQHQWLLIVDSASSRGIR